MVVHYKSQNNVKGYLALIGSALAFSLMSVCVKKLGGRIPVAEIVLGRSLISLVITNLMIAKAGISPWGKNKQLLILRGLLGTSALFCFFISITKLPLASATTVQYAYPTFTAIAAWILLKEPIGFRIVLAVILGWIGISMVANENITIATKDILLSSSILIALAGAFLTALAYVCVRKLSKTEHPLVIINYFPLVSTVVIFPFCANTGILPIGFEWLWLLGVGLLTQIGQMCITEGLTLLPAANATSINYIQVVFSAMLGFIFFDERISLSASGGALLVFFSTLLCIKRDIHQTLKRKI